MTQRLDKLRTAIGDLEEPTALDIIESILSMSPSAEDLDNTIQALQGGMDSSFYILNGMLRGEIALDFPR